MEYKDIDYSKAKKVLEVKDLRVNFKSDSGLVHAVRGVSFDLYKGETLCIVGESGSGKSVTSKTIMGILPVNAIISSGQILYDGEDLVRVSEEEFHRIRGHKIGMIFQDPLSSLNPIMKVGKQIIEATMINRNVLKRRFNELISKELVALRNEKASVIYEESKMENEVESLKLMITKLDNAIKTSVKTQNIEELETTLLDNAYKRAKEIIGENVDFAKYLYSELRIKEKLSQRELKDLVESYNKKR